MTKKSIKVKRDQFIQAYRSKAFNITAACKELKISRQTYYEWLKDPEFAEDIQSAREELIDYVESELIRSIKAGDHASIFFFLKCQAKHRGYVERQEISGPDGKPVPIEYVKVKKSQKKTN